MAAGKGLLGIGKAPSGLPVPRHANVVVSI
jgi:hypothetical protein